MFLALVYRFSWNDVLILFDLDFEPCWVKFLFDLNNCRNISRSPYLGLYLRRVQSVIESPLSSIVLVDYTFRTKNFTAEGSISKSTRINGSFDYINPVFYKSKHHPLIHLLFFLKLKFKMRKKTIRMVTRYFKLKLILLLSFEKKFFFEYHGKQKNWSNFSNLMCCFQNRQQH